MNEELCAVCGKEDSEEAGEYRVLTGDSYSSWLCSECSDAQCEHGYYLYPDDSQRDAIVCPDCGEE